MEVLFRLAMMFLRTNESRLLDKIDKNILSYPSDTESRIHQKKVMFLIRTMSAKSNSKGIPYSPAISFLKLEHAMGHDLFVKSILYKSKSFKNKTVFAIRIPELQWADFVKHEVLHGREKPSLDILLTTTEEDVKVSSKQAKKVVQTTVKKSKSSPVHPPSIKKGRKSDAIPKTGKVFTTYQNMFDVN